MNGQGSNQNVVMNWPDGVRVIANAEDLFSLFCFTGGYVKCASFPSEEKSKALATIDSLTRKGKHCLVVQLNGQCEILKKSF